jgi:hypothetical protein
MLCEFARERQAGLFLRRLRHLLPLQESLPGEIFISARSMPKKLRQRFEVTILGNEAAFKVALKHHSRGSFQITAVLHSFTNGISGNSVGSLPSGRLSNFDLGGQSEPIDDFHVSR